MERIVDLVDHQVIASVRSEEAMREAVKSPVNVIFLLFGTIFNLGALLEMAASHGKHVFLHLEFLEGISSDKSGIRYLAETLKPAGIISTRSNVIGMARENGLLAIQRLFLIDSAAVRNGIRTLHGSGADAVEVMPGVIPQMISELADSIPQPIIAGGLVRTAEEIRAALEAGALAVSAGSQSLWHHFSAR